LETSKHKFMYLCIYVSKCVRAHHGSIKNMYQKDSFFLFVLPFSVLPIVQPFTSPAVAHQWEKEDPHLILRRRRHGCC